MLNLQPPEPSIKDIRNGLEVHSIFFTIQGEGPFSGRPAIFVRLAGCNLQCPGCDTEYTAGRLATPIVHIVERVQRLREKEVQGARQTLVVITGGEPFRQDLTIFCHQLLSKGFAVQIETNGTFVPSEGLPEQVYIVCSPKAGKVPRELWPRISAYKYVLDAEHVHPLDGLPTSILGKESIPARPHPGFTGPTYVSPMDAGDVETNQANRSAAVRSCMTHNYILNLQIHKLLGLP